MAPAGSPLEAAYTITFRALPGEHAVELERPGHESVRFARDVTGRPSPPGSWQRLLGLEPTAKSKPGPAPAPCDAKALVFLVLTAAHGPAQGIDPILLSNFPVWSDGKSECSRRVFFSAKGGVRRWLICANHPTPDAALIDCQAGRGGNSSTTPTVSLRCSVRFERELQPDIDPVQTASAWLEKNAPWALSPPDSSAGLRSERSIAGVWNGTSSYVPLPDQTQHEEPMTLDVRLTIQGSDSTLRASAEMTVTSKGRLKGHRYPAVSLTTVFYPSSWVALVYHGKDDPAKHIGVCLLHLDAEGNRMSGFALVNDLEDETGLVLTRVGLVRETPAQADS